METVTKNLPELPELESIEARSTSILMVLLLCGGLYLTANVLLLFQYQHLKQYIPVQGSIMLALMTLTNLWLLIRAALSDYVWQTSEQGLVARGLLRKRLICWHDIRQADSDEPGTSSATIRLSTNDTIFKIPYDEILLASVWQHLRPMGRVDDLHLSSTVLSLWDMFPDELPREMEWRRKTSLHPKVSGALVLVVFGGLIGLMWCGFHDTGPAIVMSTIVTLMMLPCLLMSFSEAMRPSTRFAVYDDHFEAENGWGSAQVPWSDVVHAEWFKLYIIMRTQNPRRIFWVPFQATDENSCQLILAIIRNLRKASNPQALTIPVTLRMAEPTQTSASAYGAQPTEESVTLRYSPKELRLIGFLAGGFPALLILITLSRWPAVRMDDVYMLSFISVICVVAWLAVKSYSLTADETGITTCYLVGKRLLRWDEVASVDVPKVQQYRNSRKRLLKNAKGKTLMELNLGFGAVDDREKFHRLVEHYLQHALQAPDQLKRWRARPWWKDTSTP